MKKVTLTKLDNYRNNGQAKEQAYRFYKTGIIAKADNIHGADIEDIQIKSARATVGKGLDIDTIVDNEPANRFVYIDKSYIAYEMTKEEYRTFCKMFTLADRDSKKNGGQPKMRLKNETQEMMAWLAQN